ncbi:MAG: haloalkane dehalogenase [Gemmatimonadota bacterium]
MSREPTVPGRARGRWGVLAGAVLSAVAALAIGYLALDPEDVVVTDAVRAGWGGTYQPLSLGVTHYSLDGPVEGPLIVLVHGGTVPIWTWEAQVPAFTAAGYRVLTYDAYGRGFSDRPDATYGRALYAGQLTELLDSLGLGDPVHLVGLSQGGGTAVTWAAAHPERVRSLTLVAPVVFAFRIPPGLRVPVVGEIIARTVGVDMMVDRFVRMVEGHPDAERWEGLMRDQARVRGFQRSVLSMLRSDALGDFRDEYRGVAGGAYPKLLVWGTGDEEITREMVDTILALVPDIAFRPVEGAGHGVVMRQAGTVNSLLLEFLGREGAWRPGDAPIPP